MPPDIDQDQRREDVARTAAKLVAERGMGAITFRNLAAEMGCSTTAISHYFTNRDEILAETYRYVAARAGQGRKPPPGADARARLQSIERILPLDAGTWDNWVIWLCFWTEALFNPALARQQKEYSRGSRRMIEDLLESVGCPEPLAASLSQKVMTTLYGIAVQAAFDRESWTPAAQRAALHDVLQPVFDLIPEAATP
ncbi:TetR/AcrR family transcriptional regulator [Emcibacter sp. SYSU 3D8]|uniref:TetR/AcrR family transcriptional regulator n=1 Tax=Emcibacter sp. SYSU 3D8 TaxID=3133969 RepID=UPI0031FED120